MLAYLSRRLNKLNINIFSACNVESQRFQCILGDGYEKTLIPINRQLPGPLIKVKIVI